VLDQSVGHVCAGAEIYQQEADLHPDFADSLPNCVPDALIDRCTLEALLADRILVASDYVRQTLLSVGVDPSRIQFVPYGVDTDRFHPATRRDEKIFRVLFVGQLSQRKGIKYLLEAWRGLRLPNAELLLAGTLIGSGKGLAPYAGCFRHVSAVPHAEVHRLFAEADVFVYPSLLEGSALAIYEALACGLPVITTPNSGSVVRDGREGFVVPIRDVEGLQERILLLHSNHELRQEMSLRARSRAEEFTWAAYRHRLVAAILDLLTAESGEQSP
jgi:glycosyltransferase involved in cell wall biosynthesis